MYIEYKPEAVDSVNKVSAIWYNIKGFISVQFLKFLVIHE